MSFLPAILALCLLIVIHEAGHFLAARWSGMKVHEFAVGFGPKVFSFTRGETEYSFRLILLGGYVRIAGMHPAEEDAEDPRGFLQSAPWKRFVSILAGPLANYLAAFLIFFGILLFWGVDEIAPKVIQPGVNSPLAQAGLKAGDRLLSVNGKSVFPNARAHISVQFRTLLAKHDPKKPLLLVFSHNGKKKKIKLKVARKDLMTGLGIQTYTIKRVFVTSVASNSPLFSKVQSGDELLKFGKRKLEGPGSLSTYLRFSVNNDTALLLKRQGKVLSIPLLKKHPRKSLMGLKLKTVVELRVGKLKPGSVAQTDGLSPGDRLIAVGPTPLLNRFDGSLATAWKKELQSCSSKALSLEVFRPSAKRSVKLSLPRQTRKGTCASGLVLDDNEVKIDRVLPGSTADKMGLKAGDIILAMDGERIRIGTQVALLVRQRLYRKFDMVVLRKGKMHVYHIPKVRSPKKLLLGISMASTLASHRSLGIVENVSRSFQSVVMINLAILNSVKQIFQGKRGFFSNFSGPVGIVKVVARRQKQVGFQFKWLLFIAAQISISLALFNLFPIPALDGGRMMFLAMQQLVRLFGWKDQSMIKVETIANVVGFVLLFGLLIVVTIKDFLVN